MKTTLNQSLAASQLVVSENATHLKNRQIKFMSTNQKVHSFLFSPKKIHFPLQKGWMDFDDF